MALGGLICGCGGALVLLLVAALFLRLAVSTTNKLLGAGPAPAPEALRKRGGIPEWDWDDWDEDEPAPRPRRRSGAIPEPGIATCAASVFVAALLWLLAFILGGFGAEEAGLRMRHIETRLAVGIVTLPVAGLTLAVMLAVSLPTTIWRAGMVAFVYGFFCLLLSPLIGILIVVLRL